MPDDLKPATLPSNVGRLVLVKNITLVSDVSVFSSSELFQDALHFLR